MSVFSFPVNNLRKNINKYSPKLICALTLWRSGLGLQMRKFCQLLTQLSARHRSEFLFLDNDFSKCHWIFHKTKIWFGIANGQILLIFLVVCSLHDTYGVLLFHVLMLLEMCF